MDKQRFFIEEADLKSYTNFQALQAATWPVLAQFPKCHEESSSELRTCIIIGDEYESSHTGGFCNGPVTMMRKLAVPQPTLEMFSQWSCSRDEETCSSIACVGNVIVDTRFKTKTFTSLWRFEVRTLEPKECVLMNGRTLLMNSCMCCFQLRVEMITQLQPIKVCQFEGFLLCANDYKNKLQLVN